jgi:tRNA A37 N6-isopentenylltransferase MiaA
MGSMEIRKRVIAVVGPTGSGKTVLAVKLAKKYNGVLVSADSRQVYRGLDVGTNKEGEPCDWRGYNARCIDRVPQLLIDCAEPGTRFTVADWLESANTAIEQIWESNLLPIVVGGTGLYVSALLDGYELGGGRNSKNRKSVEFEQLTLYIVKDREWLYRKSDQRFERIFNELVIETQELLNRGVSADWLFDIGLDYRFATQYITGAMNRELAIDQFQRSSRAYIRRQLTWWRHHGVLAKCSTDEQANMAVDEFLNHREKNVK